MTRVLSRFVLVGICTTLLALAGCSDDDTTTQPQPGTPMTLVAADSLGHIVTVSETTGAETQIIDTFTNSGSGNVDLGVVSSMIYEPATGKWWLGTGGNADCSGCIQTLNTATGEATTLGDNSSELRGIAGLAVHPTTGKVYTTEPDGGSQLFEFNVNTGMATQIFNTSNTGNSGKGITFTSNGTFYVAADEKLHTIDLSTGMDTEIGTFTFVGFPAFVGNQQPIASLATRNDGVVFGILKDGGGQNQTSTTYLVRINLTNFQVTNIGANTKKLDGLAYIPTSMIP